MATKRVLDLQSSYEEDTCFYGSVRATPFDPLVGRRQNEHGVLVDGRSDNLFDGLLRQ